jgi:hypothetical protein
MNIANFSQAQCRHGNRVPRLQNELWAYQAAVTTGTHPMALHGLIQDCHYPVRAIAGFGEDCQADGRSLPGQPSTWRCELTGQQWSSELTGSAPRPAVSAPVRVKPAVLATPPAGATVRPLCQSNRSSCGQTSVAMGVNSLTGKRLTDRDIHNRYGFGLLQALNCESKSAGYRWHDGGNFSRKNWAALEKRLNKERTPVLMGLNGPSFSPSGRGHIVTLLSIDGQKVRYADPADGTIKVTTRRAIEQARPHPDGKFFFYAARAQ